MDAADEAASCASPVFIPSGGLRAAKAIAKAEGKTNV